MYTSEELDVCLRKDILFFRSRAEKYFEEVGNYLEKVKNKKSKKVEEAIELYNQLLESSKVPISSPGLVRLIEKACAFQVASTEFPLRDSNDTSKDAIEEVWSDLKYRVYEMKTNIDVYHRTFECVNGL